MYALVDWDNLARGFPYRTPPEDVAYDLRERLVALCSDRFPHVGELEVRCYSGWRDARGNLTSLGRTARPAIEGMAQRLGGIAVRFVCAESMVAHGAPDLFAHLAGPRDCRCGMRGDMYEQKMVDTMIVADAVALSEYLDHAVVVVGDDVDLAPGVALAGLQRAYLAGETSAEADVVWLRRRPPTRQTRTLAGVASVEEW